MKVKDALIKLEAYIADATGAGLKRVKVVHGKGTGKMRSVVRSHLSQHDRVRKYYPAIPAEGDGGVTIVELK